MTVSNGRLPRCDDANERWPGGCQSCVSTTWLKRVATRLTIGTTSSHRGKRPFETVTVDYGPQILWPDHCVQGTPGAQFHGGLQIPHAELVLRKGFRPTIDSYSAFYENDRKTPTGLGGYLRERGLTRVFAAGLALDFCVRYSAEDARREGFAVVVIEDACRGIDVDGSIAATRASFAPLRITTVGADAIG